MILSVYSQFLTLENRVVPRIRLLVRNYGHMLYIYAKHMFFVKLLSPALTHSPFSFSILLEIRSNMSHFVKSDNVQMPDK